MDPSDAYVGTWLDLEVYIDHDRFFFLPKNVNRPWLYTAGPREKAAILPWPGLAGLPILKGPGPNRPRLALVLSDRGPDQVDPGID